MLCWRRCSEMGTVGRPLATCLKCFTFSVHLQYTSRNSVSRNIFSQKILSTFLFWSLLWRDFPRICIYLTPSFLFFALSYFSLMNSLPAHQNASSTQKRGFVLYNTASLGSVAMPGTLKMPPSVVADEMNGMQTKKDVAAVTWGLKSKDRKIIVLTMIHPWNVIACMPHAIKKVIKN